MAKPTLTLLSPSKITANDVSKLYEKLTGKKMTQEERAYAKAKLED